MTALLDSRHCPTSLLRGLRIAKLWWRRFLRTAYLCSRHSATCRTPAGGSRSRYPTAQLTGRASRYAITAAAIALVLFALGFWFAYGFSRSVIGPISALRRFAVNSHDAGAEPGTAVVKTGLAEVDEVADVLRAGVRRARATQLSLDLALEESADAQAQRDLLLREVYHRVKNNLQIVDALLSMQERQLSGNEAKQALTALRGRVQVLGLVHEQLMKSGDLVTFDIAPFLDELSRNIVASGADRTVRLSVDVMPLMVTLDFAIPLGLVVTELVTNCLKHAFRQDNGRISVILHRNTKSEVVLIVSDDGGALGMSWRAQGEVGNEDYPRVGWATGWGHEGKPR